MNVKKMPDTPPEPKKTSANGWGLLVLEITE